MSIHDDIKQSAFKNAHQKATINILYTSNFLLEGIKAVLKKEGLTNQQFNVLRILRGSHPRPLSTLQIRERMIDKMSDTSRIVDRLVKKGLAQKAACRDDKRLVDIHITEKGLQALSRVDVLEDDFYRFPNKLSEEEAETLSKLLDKIRD